MHMYDIINIAISCPKYNICMTIMARPIPVHWCIVTGLIIERENHDLDKEETMQTQCCFLKHGPE